MLQRQNTKRVIAKRMRVAESGEHNVLDIIVDGGSAKENNDDNNNDDNNNDKKGGNGIESDGKSDGKSDISITVMAQA
jgi:hypothetical protein